VRKRGRNCSRENEEKRAGGVAFKKREKEELLEETSLDVCYFEDPLFP
jgi:hypothetical protein